MTEQEQKAFDQMREALEPLPQYSIDADPQGIRARVVSAVVGAMAYGASNTNKPPEGHWLNEVWDIARSEAVQQAQEPVGLNRPEIASYVARYGGNCRDCADENGICPNSGMPCDSRKAIEHVLKALDYGFKHGYIANPQATEPAGWKRDPLDLGQYVNGANISANDKPVAVIEKLQAVINERTAHHGK